MSQAGARAARVDDIPAASGPRRTVRITGHPGEPAAPVTTLRDASALREVRARNHAMTLPSRGPAIVQIDRRRPPRTPRERAGTDPDRIAMWAVVMALFLIAVTVLSSHA